MKTEEEGTVEFKNVPVESLFKDKSYQRDTNETRAARIAKRFDRARFTPLLVSAREDGRYAVVDGGHRCEAARRKGFTRVGCMVLRGLDIEEEARLFVLHGGGKVHDDSSDIVRLTPLQKYKAAVCAKDPTALAARDLLAEAGFRFGSGGKPGPTTIRSVALVQGLAKRDKAALRGALLSLSKAVGDAPPEGSLIKGMFTLHFLGVVDTVLETRVVKQTVSRMNTAALDHRTGYGHRQHGRDEARSLLQLFNYRKRVRHSLPGEPDA